MKKHLKNKQSAITIALAALIISSQPAAAAGFGDFLNNILAEFNAIKTPLAVIALMLVGVGWMFNFMDLRKVAVAIIGIIILFGAAEIVSMVTT